MKDSIFKKYYARLRRIGVLKAILWGVAIGCIAAFIAAFATWMSYSDGFFLTLGIFAGVAVIAALISYFRFFKPTTKDVARRVDALGLEERMITMLELEKSDDYIAMRQREDAKQSLERLGMSKLKLGVSLALVLMLSISGVFGLSMTTVTGLSDLGVLPSGAQLIDAAKDKSPENFVEINYFAMDGGIIYGDDEQTVKKGDSTSAVIAVPNDGYRFSRWTDGYPYPGRIDKVGDEDITYKAWFLPIDADSSEEVPGEDEANDQPGNKKGDSNSNNPDGSVVANYDYVIDWMTNYEDLFPDYYEMAMEDLSQSEDFSELLKQFIETYFNALK